VRLEAARGMLQSLDDSTVALLRGRLGVEPDSDVSKEISTGLALAALDGRDTKARLEAIATLKTSLSQDVRNRLALLLEKSPDGAFVESDAQAIGEGSAYILIAELARFLTPSDGRSSETGPCGFNCLRSRARQQAVRPKLRLTMYTKPCSRGELLL
jgi:hypothetical protein